MLKNCINIQSLLTSGKRRYVRPPNKLHEDERQGVMDILNSEAFKHLPPS